MMGHCTNERRVTLVCLHLFENVTMTSQKWCDFEHNISTRNRLAAGLYLDPLRSLQCFPGPTGEVRA